MLIVAYYLFLFSRVRRDPDYTVQAVNHKARTLWVEAVMRDRSKDIMAVQALRNFGMAATFKASSAVLLIIGTLTLSGQAESLARTWHVLNAGGSKAPELWIIKILCLLTALLVAFFAFAMTLRVLNHVVFMVSLPADAAQGALSPDRVAARLNQAGAFYTVGMRAYFITVPLAFWLFGPVLLVLSTMGLVVALYHLDRSPFSQEG
ncbi:hypothetical protein AYR66_26825 [Noviherbaspirillum denitrificans]|uniref:DUF599 domain-containing protein n=2 Tax=Noviherbaspirillum denitrificans TaxID=1968433 RepID=A0A254TKP6_9BURK|nr:hypothetical protein AYR66_26825 [Noviherbaspirillum denitrificans]